MAGSEDNPDVRCVLWEAFRAGFYIPVYATFELGAFDAEGLELRFGSIPAGVDIGAALRAGDVHVVLGGPMRVMVDHDRNPQSDLVCFGEVVARDPFFLVGRYTCPQFTLHHLLDVRLATFSEAPTPWMCLQEDLRRAGLDPNAVSCSEGQSVDNNIRRLVEGSVDAIQVPEPVVEQLLQSGKAHLWHAAADRGLTSYTTFYGTRRFLAEHPDVAGGLIRALYRGQQWVRSNSSGAIADLVRGWFPPAYRPFLPTAVARYKELGVWSLSPLLSVEGFDRQMAGVLSGNLVTKKCDYADVVDMCFAEAALEGIGEDRRMPKARDE